MAKFKKRKPEHEIINAVYDLCRRRDYFTYGNNDNYDRMFDLIRMKRPVGEVAAVIWACSDTEYVELGTINEELQECFFGK